MGYIAVHEVQAVDERDAIRLDVLPKMALQSEIDDGAGGYLYSDIFERIGKANHHLILLVRLVFGREMDDPVPCRYRGRFRGTELAFR